MSTPGSPHALVLPSASGTPGETETPGERAGRLLAPFLDPRKYVAVAVVHGLGASAPKAFDLAKERLTRSRGVVWVPDPGILDVLGGPNAATLRKVLKPARGFVLTFFSVKSKKVAGKLEWTVLNIGEIDKAFLKAGLA